MKSFIAQALMLMTPLSVSAAQTGDGFDRTVVFQNLSSHMITAIYVTVPGTDEWSSVIDRGVNVNSDVVVDFDNGGWSCLRHLRIIKDDHTIVESDNVDVCRVTNIRVR